MCKHFSDSKITNVCHKCNMYTFLYFQKAKGVLIPKDVNKIIFEKIKPWEITLYVIVDEVTETKSINLEKEEVWGSANPTQVDVKFYGNYESFMGFQAWIWLSLSYGPCTEILKEIFKERNDFDDNYLILFGDVFSFDNFIISPNYPALISGIASAIELSNIWSVKSQFANIYTVSPEIVKFRSLKKTAIDQLKREKGDNFDGHDISKLIEKLKENNKTKITPEYINQAKLDYPYKFIY